MTNPTMFDCMEAERLAHGYTVDGRKDDAMRAYTRAAELWMQKSDYSARYGETAISDMFKHEAQRVLRKRDGIIWELFA